MTLFGEILASLAYGFIKAKTLHAGPDPLLQMAKTPEEGAARLFDLLAVTPLEEEAVFRAAPLTIAPTVSLGVPAVAYGLLKFHDSPETAPTWFRALKGLEGGIVGYYNERVYRKHGLWGAWAAHAASSLGVLLGSRLPTA